LARRVLSAVENALNSTRTPQTTSTQHNRVKAANEKRLDGKKKDAKKKQERRRRDWD
jgi:hypothetical protein